MHFVNPNINVNFQRHPEVPGPPIPRLLVIFFLRFFFSFRPTDPISGNAFDTKLKKRWGWPNSKKKCFETV